VKAGCAIASDLVSRSGQPVSVIQLNIAVKYAQQAEFDRKMEVSTTFNQAETVDSWRHTRMLDMPRPIYRAFPDARWITVGDGRYGSDAAHLLRRGLSAVATSLTDEHLREAHERGLIREYRAENAEALSLPDDSFDFVLCKESYHHFPRPPIALYEMMRVARRGVVLIEPIDDVKILQCFRTLAKKVLRGDSQHEFEKSGNFLYRTGIREIRKLMMAMGGEVFAFKGINDFSIPRLRSCPARGWNLGNVGTRLGVRVQDALTGLGLLGYGLGCIIIFNGCPGENILRALRRSGFDVFHLPKNPYA
jgi:ubiquinone/menaquinone biosynthesis C-methylase UbiE